MAIDLNKSEKYREDIKEICEYLVANNITDVFGYAQAIGADVYDGMEPAEVLDAILTIEQYAEFH